MDQIRYEQTEEGNHVYSRDFELVKDLTPQNLAWLALNMADDSFNHPDLRLGYENGEEYKDVFYTDHARQVHVIGVKDDVPLGDLEKHLKTIPAGKRLYIAATGVCDNTKEEAEEAMVMMTAAVKHLKVAKDSAQD